MKTEEAIKIFGNKKKVADALGISKSAVTQWGGSVPALRAFQIKEIQGSMSKHIEVINGGT